MHLDAPKLITYSCLIRPYRVDQKKRATRLMTIILSILNSFKTFFSLEDSLVNLQLIGYRKSQHTLHMLLHYLAKH